ncbi:MAG: ABC transporter ATP-binding protein [Chloroflexi bacterium]|nr:ABC transporter ATP-binding protein [Chloroflexota bacterium]
MIERLQRMRRPREADSAVPTVRVSHLLALLWPYWPGLAAAGCLLLIATGAELVFPLGIRQMIDSVFVAGDAQQLNLVALVLVAIFAVQALARYAQSLLVSGVGERLVMDLRERVAAHVLGLSMRFFDTRKSGELMSILGNDIGQVRQGTLDSVLQLVPQLATLVGSIVLAATLNWRLTLIVLAVGPITAGLTVLVGRRIRAITTQSLEQLGRATAVLNEALSSPRVVKAFARERYEIERYRSGLREVLAASLRRARAQSALGPANGLFFFLSFTAVLWFGGREVLAGRLTPGELVAFLIYLGMVTNPINRLSNLYAQLQQSLGAAQRVFALLVERPHVADRPGASPLVIGEGGIAFEHVAFTYGDDRPVLDDVSLVVEAGQTVALVGPSGAGKTTAIALLLRLYDVTGGRIMVDGQDIREVTQESLRAQMALVPQEPVLFGATVAENIRYGRLDARPEEIEAAARAANAHEFIAALPRGYETQVGERGVQLSVGQRQRITIARAVLRDPRILLLDEATASLDNESEHLVQEALERLMAERTTLVIAHRLTTVEHADRIVVLAGGRVVEQGTPAELTTAGGLYHRLLTRRFAEDGRESAHTRVGVPTADAARLRLQPHQGGRTRHPTPPM